MPKDFFYETACAVDHESGECRVDTTMRGIAAMLVRAGFEEVTKPSSAPYRRFVGKADQVRFRKPKGQRRQPKPETIAKLVAASKIRRRATVLS